MAEEKKTETEVELYAIFKDGKLVERGSREVPSSTPKKEKNGS